MYGLYTKEKQMRQQSEWLVLVFGKAKDSNSVMDGEIHVMASKVELDKFLNDKNIVTHKNDHLAGQLIHMLPDGRAVSIVHGRRKMLDSRVFIK
jgi:hypothetical protein